MPRTGITITYHIYTGLMSTECIMLQCTVVNLARVFNLATNYSKLLEITKTLLSENCYNVHVHTLIYL